MLLARQNARTPILHAFSVCDRVYVRGKEVVAFLGGGASKPHRSKYILVGTSFQKLPHL